LKNNKTHFGFKEVNEEDKQPLVENVFSSVASNYDRMNDLMSFGIHRFWKKFVSLDNLINDHDAILDLAGGSGDLSILFKKKNEKANVIHSDINKHMLKEGQKKIINQGLQVPSMVINAEMIPFKNNTFSVITIGFGLRNMTDQKKVLAEVFRCLKPGGKIVILEFSKIQPALQKIYDFFSFDVIPRIGKIIVKDSASYEYLAESIRMHPDQETLLSMLEAQGYCNCRYQNLTAGVVAVHSGFKP
jgi:demethylmenaquinone methyltransferase / 2-methoxy-6-polyprenyl-1,4-benzoquinol methylase